MNLVASEPQELRIVKRNPNGSGVVRMPLLRAAAFTSGPYEGDELNAADLAEVVKNFALWPGPVPVNVSPHRKFSETGGASPGFIESVAVEGDTLFAEVFLTAGLFAEVDAGMWRGFSVDIFSGLKMPTVTFEGHVISGGVFTNRPATDVNYRIAASADLPAYEIDSDTPHVGAFLEFRLKDAARGKGMSESTVAALEVAVNESNEKVSKLEADLAKERNLKQSLQGQIDTQASDLAVKETEIDELRKTASASNLAASQSADRVTNLEADIATIRGELKELTESKRKLAVKLEANESRNLAADVMKLVHGAIEKGVSAALFEGVEADPAAWFNARYADIKALEAFLSALPTVKSSATTSGKPDAKSADLSTEQAKQLERIGLNPDLASIEDENQFLDYQNAKSKK